MSEAATQSCLPLLQTLEDGVGEDGVGEDGVGEDGVGGRWRRREIGVGGADEEAVGEKNLPVDRLPLESNSD